tara:strand:- start:2930 stop:3976 length:1047 start_codon:yes stop_codon:yes gene_type:complete
MSTENEALTVNIGQVSDALDRILEPDPNAEPETPVVVEEPIKEVIEEPAKEPEPVKEAEPVKESTDKNPIHGLRKAHEETKKELSTLKEQLADFEGTRKERDELKARITEYEETVTQLRKVDSIAKLENDPDFQKKYVAGRETVVSKLKELAGYADIDPGEILSAMGKSPKERYAALDDALSLATPTLAGKIRAEVDRLESLESERNAELSNAQQAIDRLKAERIREQDRLKADYETRSEHAFKTSAAQLAKELNIDEATINKARDFFKTNGSTEEAAKVVIKAFAADGAFGKVSESQKRIAELETELAKYQESSPGVTGGVHGSAKAPETGDFIADIKAGIKELRIF